MVIHPKAEMKYGNDLRISKFVMYKNNFWISAFVNKIKIKDNVGF